MTTPCTPTACHDVVVPCEHGLHLRVASKVVTAARPFASRVWLSTTHVTADAKSILALLQLGAVRGTRLTITARGSDAESAIAAMVALFHDARFCSAPAAIAPSKASLKP